VIDVLTDLANFIDSIAKLISQFVNTTPGSGLGSVLNCSNINVL